MEKSFWKRAFGRGQISGGQLACTQVEVIVGTFEVGNLQQKLDNFFSSLIMGFIMGGFEIFSKFLSSSSH